MPEPTSVDSADTREELGRLLHVADRWTPTTPTPLLVREGRRRHRLTRLRRTAPLAAAAAAAVVALVVLRPGIAPVTAPAAPSTAPSATTSAPSSPSSVSLAEVRTRCAPQVARFGTMPQYAAAMPPNPTWTPVLPGPYHVGDRLLLRVTAPVTTPAPNPRWCLVPGEGRADDPVPAGTFSLLDLPAAEVPALCRQLAAPEDPGLDDPSARVLARTPGTADAGPVVALVKTATHVVACSTVPLGWDAGVSTAQVVPSSDNPAADLSATLTGPAGKSIGTPTAAWYYGVGAVPGASRVVVTVDGTDHEAVVAEGVFAVAVEMRGVQRLSVPTVSAYRPDGALVGRWSARRGVPEVARERRERPYR